MDAPFIVVRTFKIREGKRESFKEFLREFFKTIEAKEPDLLALNAYVNDAGTEVTFVHIHSDAASMEFHEEVAHEQTKRAHQEFLDATTSLQVYGKPSDAILAKTKKLAQSGIP